jgi:hypothetical protein
MSALAAAKRVDVAVPALLEQLSSDDARQRIRAAETLSLLGPQAPSAIPALLTALNDPEPVVRQRAIRGLGNIRGTGRGGPQPPKPRKSYPPWLRSSRTHRTRSMRRTRSGGMPFRA